MPIRYRADMVYIEHAVGHRAAAVNSGLGARIPIGNTASGRAYAAALSAADREQFLADLEQQDREQWQRLVAALPGTLDLYARSGFVLDRKSTRLNSSH